MPILERAAARLCSQDLSFTPMHGSAMMNGMTETSGRAQARSGAREWA